MGHFPEARHGSKARCLPCLCARSQRAFAELHGRPSRGGCSTAQGEKAGGWRHPERLRSKHRDRGIPAFPTFPRLLRLSSELSFINSTTVPSPLTDKTLTYW